MTAGVSVCVCVGIRARVSLRGGSMGAALPGRVERVPGGQSRPQATGGEVGQGPFPLLVNFCDPKIQVSSSLLLPQSVLLNLIPC